MRRRGILFIIAAAAALPGHALGDNATSRTELAESPPAIVYCYDRGRDAVAQVLVAECQGTVVSEADAQAVTQRRDRKIMEAMTAQPQIGRDGLRIASLGTAFYVDETGRLLTNYHVVRDCKAVTVLPSSGEEKPARVLTIDAKEDMALLQADTKPRAVAVFRLEEGAGREPAVATVGYPDQGLPPREPIVTSGVLLGVAARGLPEERLVIRADIRKGNSGGPLFDNRGLVIGMVNAKIDTVRLYNETGRDVGDTGFGIPLPTLLEFLRRNDARFHQAKGGEVLDPEQLLRRARQLVVRAECWK